MKTASWVFLLTAGLAAFMYVGGAVADEMGWIDMDNCECCRALTSREGLMECLNVETVPISDGIVTIYTVTPDKLADYRDAHKQMRAIVQKRLIGGDVGLCGHCQAMIGLIEMGATREYVKTSTGGVCLITCADQKVQKKIREFYQKDLEMKEKAIRAPQQEDQRTASEG